MKVFISGPMSGYEDFNHRAFMEAEKKLVEAGYSVFNPAWLNVDDTWSHNELMSIDISALTVCDAIYQLEGWEESKGARVEYAYALHTGKKFVRDKDILESVEPNYTEMLEDRVAELEKELGYGE